MTRLIRCLALILTLWPAASRAQEAVQLVADSMMVSGESLIIATGNVEVAYQGMRLRASQVIYDRRNDNLRITGPITLQDGDSFFIVADAAELDTDLRNGIMESARMVLDGEMQIAANALTRRDGRYTNLHRAIASSCEVCPAHPVPFWEVRAETVTHDQETRQLYFRNAQLRVLGVPIFYTPRLRMPGPSLTRATGFLLPSVHTTTQLGTGVKAPYFIRIGDHRDLTLTPYVSGNTTTLEGRWRQAYHNGDLLIRGAVSSDTILPDETRGYLFAEGAFDLRNDYKLAFDIEVTTDDAYLLDYGYSDKDRLDSAISLTRTQRDRYFGAELTNFTSLRDGESNATIPSIVGDFTFQRRLDALGGIAEITFDAHSHYRGSDMPGTGRDVSRASGVLDWQRDWMLGNGMVAGLGTNLRYDFYGIQQGAPGETDTTRFLGTGFAELRWPMARAGASGATQLFEPVVQLVWSDSDTALSINEDSTLTEFDEGNLFSLSRFPGVDAQEQGLRANLGFGWTRHDPSGWSLGVTAGRILRAADAGQFGTGSGLNGTRSHWLAAVQLDANENLSIMNRALFDDRFDLSRNELRLNWKNARIRIGTSYLWMAAVPSESRPETQEWTFDSSFYLGQNWTAGVDWRYDFVADRAAHAGLNLGYETDCISIDFTVSRRFTSSTSVDPTTSFGVSVSLIGFGSTATGTERGHRCAT